MSKEIENKTTSISKDNKPLREKEVYFGSKDELEVENGFFKFSEIANGFEYGVSAEAIKYDGINQYIRITDITDNGRFDKTKISSPSKGIDDKYLVYENDILLARTGASVGKSYLYNKHDGLMYFAGFLIRMNVTELNSYYVKSFLSTSKYWNQVETMSARSGQPGLNAEEYKHFEIKRISKDKSTIIGNLLSQIDNLILNNSINQKSLNKLRKISLEQLMLKNTVDSVAFYELFEILEGLKGVNKENFEKSPNSCFISFKSIHSNNIYESTLENVYVDNFDMQNSVCYNDILITMSSENIEDIGIVSINKVKLKNLFLNSFSKILRVKNNYNPDYIYYLLKHSYYRKMIMNEGQGITRINLSINRISNIIIDLPNIEEQNKIANILSQMDKLIEIEEKKLEKLTEMKKYFLQQFFD